MKKGNVLVKLFKIVFSLILMFAVYWFALPPINLRSPSFWLFLIICILIFLAVNYFYSLIDVIKNIKKSPKDIFHHLSSSNKNTKDSKRLTAVSLGAICIIFVILFFGSLIGAKMFNASRYTSLITTENGNFTEDVAELSMSQIPVVDRDSASRLGKRKLGEMSDLVSQFEISEFYTQINYKGSPQRVTPLSYADPIKWLNNQNEGLPGYISVNMVTQEATLTRLDKGIKYSTSDYFMRNIDRHLRFSYPTKIFDSISFEIDENGTPYWVAPTISYKIGFWSGKDISGAVLVNAVTGECTYYDINEIPTWVDQVYTSDLVIEQLNFNGLFQSGYLNSIFGQKGVLQTTEGYNYIAIGDDVYLYTGMTSVVSDESNVGFVLVNLRTKETKFYSVPGAEEYSAMDSAQGQVQHLNYVSTFPLLLNVYDRPTYFMSLKDAAGLVKMYAFVDVEQYQIVGTGSNVNDARENYLINLKGSDLTVTQTQTETVTGRIKAISSVVVDGNTKYYIMLENDVNVYSADILVSNKLPFFTVGEMVKVTYSEGVDERIVSEIK